MEQAASSSASQGRGPALRRRGEQRLVAATVEHEAVLGLHVAERLVELGVDEQDRGARVLDDVGDLGGGQPEVHGDEHPAPRAHPEEAGQEPGRVGTHDGDAGAGADTELVEGHGHAPGPGLELVVRKWTQRAGHSGLVDHGRAPGVREHGPLQEVPHGECHPHWSGPPVPWSPRGTPDRSVDRDTPTRHDHSRSSYPMTGGSGHRARRRAPGERPGQVVREMVAPPP